jgi:hypothetical protein
MKLHFKIHRKTNTTMRGKKCFPTSQSGKIFKSKCQQTKVVRNKSFSCKKKLCVASQKQTESIKKVNREQCVTRMYVLERGEIAEMHLNSNLGVKIKCFPTRKVKMAKALTSYVRMQNAPEFPCTLLFELW